MTVKTVMEKRHQAKQTTLIYYFKKNSEQPPIDPKMADDDPVSLMIHSQGIALASNDYIFIFDYRSNVI
jgi:hypothetical protein